jgi:polysaccharide export outer membrane protein
MKKNTSCFLAILFLFTLSGYAYADGYTIGEEDMLQISVWGNTDLSVHVPVRPDGMISMPLVGDIKAGGLTPQILKMNIEKELRRFVKSPVVSIMVTSINSFKVYIIGDGVSGAAALRGTAESSAAGGGQASGQITLKRSTTLLQLLAQLGPLGNIDLPKAYLLRSGKKLTVDFEELVGKGDFSQDLKLEPNDIIYLPGGYSSRVRVTGEVKTPGVIPYADGMTALDAVLSAGGFTDFASRNGVVILRKEGDGVKDITAKLRDVMNGDFSKNVFLKPGDIVTVKRSWF